MLVDHENPGIDTNFNILSDIFTEIWAKIGFYVMAAINHLRRKYLSPKNSILFLCDEDEFVENHQNKINSVAIFLTSNSNFTGLQEDVGLFMNKQLLLNIYITNGSVKYFNVEHYN